MYGTPIVYPLSEIPDWLSLPYYALNPMVAIVESFRYAFLGSGCDSVEPRRISWFVTLVILFIGVILFSRIEKTLWTLYNRFSSSED
jgi:lipopolysaccharide transport system permease protein